MLLLERQRWYNALLTKWHLTTIFQGLQQLWKTVVDGRFSCSTRSSEEILRARSVGSVTFPFFFFLQSSFFGDLGKPCSTFSLFITLIIAHSPSYSLHRRHKWKKMRHERKNDINWPEIYLRAYLFRPIFYRNQNGTRHHLTLSSCFESLELTLWPGNFLVWLGVEVVRGPGSYFILQSHNANLRIGEKTKNNCLAIPCKKWGCPQNFGA